MSEIIIGDRYALMEGALVIDRGVSSKNAAQPIGDLRTTSVKGGSSAMVMEWGADNCRPSYREQLVADNNIVPALMMTRRNIILGRGLMAYRNVIVDGKMEVEQVEIPKYAEDFFDRSDITTYLATAARNEVFHSAIPTEYILDKLGRVSRIRALESRHIRLEEQDKQGISRNMYWKGAWTNRKRLRRTVDQEAQRIRLYRPGQEMPRGKFGTFVVDDLLCLDEYYPQPYWEGSEEWISLANKIPQFHDANLSHGYSMRWHIEIPKGYFLDSNALDQVQEEDKRKEIITNANSKKKQFLTKLNETLQGLKNAGKTVVTEYDIDKSLSKEFPGIKITPLTYDMKDEALLKLFDASNAANMSAQGIHPTLANIQTQGKLSSGSEIRNAYLMYVAIHTPAARERLLRPINLVKKLNGWDKAIHFGFRDMLITRLDDDKSGTSQTNQNNA